MAFTHQTFTEKFPSDLAEILVVRGGEHFQHRVDISRQADLNGLEFKAQCLLLGNRKAATLREGRARQRTHCCVREETFTVAAESADGAAYTGAMGRAMH